MSRRPVRTVPGSLFRDSRYTVYTPSAISRENAWVIGVVARTLPLGSYAALQWISDALNNPRKVLGEEEVNSCNRLVKQLVRQYQAELEAWLHAPHPGLRGQAHIARVMENLRQFCRFPELTGYGGSPFSERTFYSSSGFDLASSTFPTVHHQIDQLLADPPFKPFGREDARAIALVRWFKGSYMKWIDPIKCPKCAGPTESDGTDEPTTEERDKGGGRVEIHKCIKSDCGGVRRFVRYNKYQTLMHTREGRCGEWAHLFWVFLKASGLDSRYVWNSEDHVWTEYWSPARKHWVHVDSCEGAVNKPLLYDRGWGKKQAFCIAIGPKGAEDVTPAYVTDWPACLARRHAFGWSEKALQNAVTERTVDCRLRMTDEERQACFAMDESQAMWVADVQQRLAEAEAEHLGGRTSGTADWRARRAELGKAVSRPTFVAAGHSNDSFRFLGDARQTDDGICLTSAPGQTSAVFRETPVSQSHSWKCQVRFKLSAPPGAGEADGIAVVFSPEIKLGLPGYGLGYSGLGGQGDFAVEIDTYRTQDHADDPSCPHISVHSPPNAHHRHSIACAESLPFLSDGKECTLELLFDGDKRLLRGYLHLPGEEELDLWEVEIPRGEGRDWYVGVTGSCGGLWQKQNLWEWTFEPIAFQ